MDNVVQLVIEYKGYRIKRLSEDRFSITDYEGNRVFEGLKEFEGLKKDSISFETKLEAKLAVDAYIESNGDFANFLELMSSKLDSVLD